MRKQGIGQLSRGISWGGKLRSCGTRRDVLGPAFERSPATDAVAMMEPEEVGFDFEVFTMAFAAYLIARNTLVVLMDWSAIIALEPTVLSKGVPPQNVRPHCLHELISINLLKSSVRSHNSSVCKHDV